MLLNIVLALFLLKYFIGLYFGHFRRHCSMVMHNFETISFIEVNLIIHAHFFHIDKLPKDQFQIHLFD